MALDEYVVACLWEIFTALARWHATWFRIASSDPMG